MNTIRPLVLAAVLCAACFPAARAQDMSALPAAERDSILIALAKEAILKYGPDYYGETDRIPVITRRVVTKEAEENGGLAHGFRAGRVEYSVSYPNDREYLERNPYAGYRMQVQIWEDTGMAFGVMFGHYGMIFNTSVNSTKYNANNIKIN